MAAGILLKIGSFPFNLPLLTICILFALKKSQPNESKSHG
tara:strand:+ start:122 stop:241 length:120 start_codon:yes stop_codon:yes gene_type:complete